MVYFVYGDDSSRIRQSVKTLTKKSLGNEKDDMNYVRFNGREVVVQEVVYECSFLPLGYDKKVVVLEDAYFLLPRKEKVKIESEQDYNVLNKYLYNSNPDVDLIISIESKELNNKSEIVKSIFALKESGEVNVFEANKPEKEDWRNYIIRYFRDILKVQIDNDAINELESRCNGDIYLFQNYAKILSLYTNHVTYNDVCLFVIRPLEDNVFEIYNSLITNRNDEAIRLYRNLRISGKDQAEPVTIVNVLAKQFRFLYQVSFLIKNGYSVDDVAKALGTNSRRVNVVKKQIYTISESVILKTLEELFNLDYNIKSGRVADRFYAFEMFLINFKAE